MQKYFITKEELLENKITGDDVFHIKNVMRGRIGDEIIVTDEETELLVKLTQIEKNYVCFEIEKEIENNNELKVNVDLYQGYPKGDKLDDIIKYSTQLGINKIIPTLMRRSIIKIDPQKVQNKTIRFNKIAKESAEQSNRKKLSKVLDPIKLDKIDFSQYDYKIICYEEDAKEGECSNFKKIISNLKPNDSICVVVGPEGGIDDTEVEYLKSQGFTSCALGPRILRTETAILYVLSAVSYEMELK